MPDGTWFMSAKVENDQLWALIKEGKIRGFSIAAELTQRPANDEIDTLEDLMEYINKLK